MDGFVIVSSLLVPIGPKWSQQYQILQNIPKQTFTFQVFQVNHKTEHISWTPTCGMIPPFYSRCGDNFAVST